MDDDNTAQTKQKGQGKEKKKNIDKGDDKLFLLGNINSNVNVFSQLSNMYQTQETDETAYSSTSQSSTDSSKNPNSKQDPIYAAFIQSQKNFDFEITKILNKLNKKSETTKLRALSELKAVLSDRPEDFYKTFFPTWLYIYKQMVTSEFDKKILEESNNILLLMAPKLKKNLAPFIKDLFPYWFSSMNDPVKETSEVATKAFEQTFPENKYSVVLSTCADQLVEYISNTFRLTPKKIQEENGNLDDTQSEEVYDRVVISCLNSISAALKINTNAADPSIFINKVIDMLSINQPLKGNSILLTLLHNKKRPRVRAGVIELIDALILRIDNRIFGKNISTLTNMLLDILDDKERSVQRSLWKDCLLRVMKTAISEEASGDKVELKKYETKVLHAVKTAGSGLGPLVFNRLVEFFSYLESFSNKNFESVGDKIEDRVTFYRKFFSHITLAYNHEEVKFFGDELTNSYFECALFCIIKRILPLAEEAKNHPPKNYEATLKTLRGFIREVLITPCQEYLKKYSKSSSLSPYKNIAPRLGDTLNHIELKPEIQDQNLFRDFESDFIALFEKNTKTFSELDNYFSLLQGCIKVGKGSVLYVYFQDLINKCNTHFQAEMRTSFLDQEVVISDSLLEKKAEDLKKIEHFNGIFVFDPQALNNPVYYNLVEENFSNLVDLTKKFLENFDKVVKISNVEKFARFTMKTVNNMLFLHSSTEKQLESSDRLQSKLNELLDHLTGFISNQNPAVSLNTHNLILISFLLNPCAADSFFSEFIAYNNNKISEDALLNRALESYIRKSKDEKSYFLQRIDNSRIQTLIQEFVAKLLVSEKYRLFAPTICQILLFSAQEQTVQNAVEEITQFLNVLVTNKGKLSIEFDKLEPLFSSLAIIIKVRSLSTIESAHFEMCFLNLVKILTALYSGSGTSRKRALLVYEFLKKVPVGSKLPEGSNLKELKTYIIQSIHVSVLAQLEVNLIKKEATGKLKLENLVKMVEDYLRYIIHSNDHKNLTQFYEDLLNERFFITSMVTPDIWKVLMICFEITQPELDIKKVFALRDDGKLNANIFWLIIEMISVVSSNSLLLNPREKKFFTVLSNDFFIHELLTVSINCQYL